MFEHQLTKNLKDGEEVLRFVRRYPGSLTFPILVAALFLLGPFFFLFPLLRLGVFGVVLFLALFGFGGFFLLRLLLVYSLNVLIITNFRLIDVDQRGYFHRIVSESTYDKIQDVSFSMKGIRQTLFRYGDVLIQTAGAQANLEIRNVRDPEKVQELIAKLQGEYSKSGESASNLTAEELLQMVQRIKEGIGDEGFNRLVAGKKR